MAQGTTIAVLGTGTMGGIFARRLLAAGMRVNAWDVVHAAAARLAEVGASVAERLEDAVANADVVLTMVPTIASIEETMPRALAAMKEGAIWLQMSTIGVEGTRRAHALAVQTRADVVFVDAPVSGSKTPAENGKLLILASGPSAALDALAPVFEVLGQKTMRWERVGAGSQMKLVMNTWLAVLAQGMSETATLAQSLDLPLEDFAACLSSTQLSAPWALAKLQKIQQGTFDAEFALGLATKDVHLALDAVAETKAKLPVVESLAAQWDRALQSGFGDRDVIGAYLALEKSA
jgi:3-hydroxyisobutyrate dehydrogenase